MQVFLPYSNYYKSALTLHPKYHLGNQYWREGMTLLRGGWSSHPVSKMWKDYRYSLCDYLFACERVLKNVYHKEYLAIHNEIEIIQRESKNTGMPPFIGNEEFHASHRSKLLFKGEIFGLTEAISKFTGLSYKKYKEHFKLPDRNQLNQEHKEWLINYCKMRDIKYINHYRQFGWTEPDNLDYVWPLENNRQCQNH